MDACFLADHGVRVVACDSSSQMIKVATRRVAEGEKASLVETRVMAAEDIADLRGGEAFDGAFSNFGALNCVEDLPQLARNLAALLKPGATALLCWMGSCCLWEIIWYLGRGDPRKAFRRFRRGGVTARLAQGTSIRVHYPSVRSLARTFAPEFRLKVHQGHWCRGAPSYLEPWASGLPICSAFPIGPIWSWGAAPVSGHWLTMYCWNSDGTSYELESPMSTLVSISSPASADD